MSWITLVLRHVQPVYVEGLWKYAAKYKLSPWDAFHLPTEGVGSGSANGNLLNEMMCTMLPVWGRRGYTLWDVVEAVWEATPADHRPTLDSLARYKSTLAAVRPPTFFACPLNEEWRVDGSVSAAELMEAVCRDSPALTASCWKGSTAAPGYCW